MKFTARLWVCDWFKAELFRKTNLKNVTLNTWKRLKNYPRQSLIVVIYTCIFKFLLRSALMHANTGSISKHNISKFLKRRKTEDISKILFFIQILAVDSNLNHTNVLMIYHVTEVWKFTRTLWDLFCMKGNPSCLYFNPNAFRMAKTPLSFGHSDCNRVK